MLKKAFNVPNLITLTRIALVPVFVLALLSRIQYGEIWAALLFVIGAATDGVDGYVARRYNQITTVGKLMDPLADKLLVAAALIALVELGSLSTWVVLVILGREFAVTGLRALAAADGLVISASGWGKLKTTLQVIAITMVMLQNMQLYDPLRDLLRLLGPWAIGVAVAVTIWSGLDYLWRYFRVAMAR